MDADAMRADVTETDPLNGQNWRGLISDVRRREVKRGI